MDNLPDYSVEQQRLKAQIAEQRATVERQRLEILEMTSRQNKHKENIKAALKAIEDYSIKLKDLENVHGVLNFES